MLKLIRLEMAKNNTAKYALYAMICIVLLTAFLLAIDFAWGFEDIEVMKGIAPPITLMAEMLASIVFIIMSGIMHAAFTVGAYKNKTMDLMFSYPIKRRKILLSKIFAVMMFNFFFLLVTQAVMYGAIHVTGRFFPPAYSMNYDFTSVRTYVMIAAKSLMASCIGIFALFIGMVKKSPVATIVSSFMSVALLQGTIGQTSLIGSFIIPAVIVVIATFLTAAIISGAEKKDIL